MHFQLEDPSVQAALIGGLFTLVATVIAAIAAAVIGKRFDKQKRLRDLLNQAMRDLAFALAVEEEHCEMHRASSGESNKNRVRERVREKGYEWSGHFTRGRIRDTILHARIGMRLPDQLQKDGDKRVLAKPQAEAVLRDERI